MISTVSGKTYTFLLLQEKQNINWKKRYGYFCYYDDHVTIATESVDMTFFIWMTWSFAIMEKSKILITKPERQAITAKF